jgi:opacity protein-like surface antigen
MKSFLFLAVLAAAAASPLLAGNAFAPRGSASKYSPSLPPPPPVVVPTPSPAPKPTITLTFEHYFRIRESQYLELAAVAQAKGDTQSAGRLRTAASVQVMNRMIYADIMDEPYNGELGSISVMPKG